MGTFCLSVSWFFQSSLAVGGLCYKTISMNRLTAEFHQRLHRLLAPAFLALALLMAVGMACAADAPAAKADPIVGR
jgi:hypothetical protein